MATPGTPDPRPRFDRQFITESMARVLVSPITVRPPRQILSKRVVAFLLLDGRVVRWVVERKRAERIMSAGFGVSVGIECDVAAVAVEVVGRVERGWKIEAALTWAEWQDARKQLEWYRAAAWMTDQQARLDLGPITGRPAMSPPPPAQGPNVFDVHPLPWSVGEVKSRYSADVCDASHGVVIVVRQTHRGIDPCGLARRIVEAVNAFGPREGSDD